MSLDKSTIPKRGNSSRKFIPKKQRRAMIDPFVERITRARTDNGETVSGRMVNQESEVLRRAKSYARSGGPMRTREYMDRRGETEGWRVNLLWQNKAKILPLPPGHWTERRCRNCPTSLLKLWQLEGLPRTTP